MDIETMLACCYFVSNQSSGQCSNTARALGFKVLHSSNIAIAQITSTQRIFTLFYEFKKCHKFANVHDFQNSESLILHLWRI